jgi:hypothetical protein
MARNPDTDKAAHSGLFHVSDATAHVIEDQTFHVVAKPHPFDCETVFCQFRHGMTIAEALGEHASHSAQVILGGVEVPRELWSKVRPRIGMPVEVILYPQGGNGGKVLRIVAIVALMYLTAGASAGLFATAGGMFAAGSTSAAVLAAGISIVGSMAINALIPPPSPKMSAQQDPFQQLASITGTSNQATPYGVIPCVVGTVRFFPPHAALPYTEISGSDQYLRMLLDLGWGDLDISDIQIGSSPISSYSDVEYEISTTPTLFSQDIYEASVATTLVDGGSASRTTQLATTEISLDLVFGNGLFGVDNKGNTTTSTAYFTVQYRVTGSPTWIDAGTATGLTLTGGFSYASGTFTLASAARKMLRTGIRWKVASGQYDVQVTRGTTVYGATTFFGDCTWTVMRSVSPQLPSTTGTLKLAVRIKATGQLNGIVQNLSVLAAQKIPTYNTGTSIWSTNAANTNPAWIAAWLMTRCPAVVRRLADSRLDLQAISDWATEVGAKGYSIGFVMDSPRAFGDVLNDVFAAGRAARGMRNGLYAPVRDVAQTVPIQMFTPANSSGFNYARPFANLPHALKVTFTNPAANYQQDVMIVYADGYNADGSSGLIAATRFETLDLRTMIDPNATWRIGRYHLAVMYNRPTIYSLTADVEHIVCERGDLVHVAHDVIGWGVAWGRIKDVSGSSVTVDGPVTLAAGKTYAIRVRRNDNSQITDTITTGASVAQTLTLTTALTSADIGNLFIIGEVNKTITPLIVKSIQPVDDMSAQMTFVDYSTTVINADSGTPPTFVSSITGTSWCAAPADPVVSIRAGDSAPDDAGVIVASTGVTASPPGGIQRIPIWKRQFMAGLD